MPGFFITNTNKVPQLKNYNDANCLRGEIKYHNWNVRWNCLDKYRDDKIFTETDEAIICLDGVILNKKDLIKKYDAVSWLATVLLMCNEDKVWFKKLRGSFAGAVLNKTNGEWTCFTDQCGGHLLLTYAGGGRQL